MTNDKVFQQLVYMKNAPTLAQAPADLGAEVAFAGRSNAGKSSAVNAIAGRKALARISKTPGRTRDLVFFAFNDRARLVDLPGYGYAKVSSRMRAQWGQAMEEYLARRDSLAGVFLVMDVRHPLTDFDVLLLDWCDHARLAVHLLLTKADKLSHGAGSAVLHQVRGAVRSAAAPRTVQLFSATRRIGLTQARSTLLDWLALNEEDGTRT